MKTKRLLTIGLPVVLASSAIVGTSVVLVSCSNDTTQYNVEDAGQKPGDSTQKPSTGGNDNNQGGTGDTTQNPGTDGTTPIKPGDKKYENIIATASTFNPLTKLSTAASTLKANELLEKINAQQILVALVKDYQQHH